MQEGSGHGAVREEGSGGLEASEGLPQPQQRLPFQS